MERKKKIRRRNDHSSDEEELFSYLTKVQNRKPPERLCQSSRINQNAISVEIDKTVKDNKQNPNAINTIDKNVEVDDIKTNENTEDGGVENSNVKNNANIEQNVAESYCLDTKIPCEGNEQYNEGDDVEGLSKDLQAEKVETSWDCSEAMIPFEENESHKEAHGVEDIDGISKTLKAEKMEPRVQENEGTECDNIKQDTGSPDERDKYFLISENDWLTLCARLENTENVGNMKKRIHSNVKGSSVESLLPVCSRSSFKETNSLYGKGKSLLSVYKEYNRIPKSHLKETDSSQSISNTSPKKQIMSVSSRSGTQIGKHTDQLVSQNKNQLSESIKSTKSEIKASPKVEIVYISLEDGNIKYESPLPNVKNTGGDSNLNAIRGLHFCQQNTMHGAVIQKDVNKECLVPNNKSSKPFVKDSNVTNSTAIRKIDFCQQNTINIVDRKAGIKMQRSLPDNNNIECIDLVNDSRDAIKMACNIGNTYAVLNNPLHVPDKTRHDMQVRFVRIDNKLTKVYEDVKQGDCDKDLDFSGYNQNEQHGQLKEDLEFANHDDVDGSTGKNDSFNFDDSQLIAFPLVAYDPENINQDDSLTQLTPSKLDILNTSCNQDSLTPNKVQILSHNEMHRLTPSKLQWRSPSNLQPSPPSQLDIFPTSAGDLHTNETLSISNLSISSKCSADLYKTTESPIVLTVTKSGALVQCESNEKSSSKVESTSKAKESVNNSNLQNLWKTFRPVQHKTKRNDLNLSADEDSKQCSKRTNEKNDCDCENDDDLTDYFLPPNNSNKDLVKENLGRDLSKRTILEPTTSILVQASGPIRETLKGSQNGEKLKNVKMVNQETQSSENNLKVDSKRKLNRSKCTTGRELYSTSSQTKIFKSYTQMQSVVSSEIDKDISSSVSCIDSSSQTGKKRKGRTKISKNHKDCNDKQEDFKDFEIEPCKLSRKRKIIVDTKREDSVDVSNILNANESQNELSKIKEGKVPHKKRKVNSDELKDHSESIQDVQEKSKKSVKKSCSKKSAKLVTTKIKKSLEEKNEIKLKNTLESAEVSHSNEIQKKLEFLENCYVKLKEADASEPVERGHLLESPSKNYKVGASCDMKTNNKFENVSEVKTNETNTRVKKQSAGKRFKNTLDGVSAAIPVDHTEQVSKLQQSDKSSKGKRNGNKAGAKNKNEKNNSKLCQIINDLGARLNMTKNCTGKETRAQTVVVKSQNEMSLRSKGKKPEATSDIIMIDRKKLEDESKLDSNSGNKSKSRRQRTSRVRKKSQIVPAKELQTKSYVSVNANVVENKRTKSKPKSSKIATSKKDERVINETDKEFVEKSSLEGEAEKGQDRPGYVQKNKENKAKTRKSKAKRVPIKLENRIVKSKNIDLNTSSSMDELDKRNKNEKYVHETVVVVSPGSESLDSDKCIDSDCKKQGTIVSILATFQPLQGEESLLEEDIKSMDTQKPEAKHKVSHQSKRNKRKLDKGKQEGLGHKNKTISKCSDKKVSKRNLKIVNDIIQTNKDKDKVPKEFSAGEESQDEKSCLDIDHDKDSKIKSLKTPKTGKVKKVKDSTEKELKPKSLKTARKLTTRSKLKPTSRRQRKETWKDLLDDDAFKVDINELASEKHKPVNVRHMIRKILKTTQGKEKTGDKQVTYGRCRERKEKSDKCNKSSSSTSQLLASESDDAWVSDSSMGTSFPAFQFTSGSDSEADWKTSKALKDDNLIENTSKPAKDRIKIVTDTKHCEQNYIELHHSPVKVSDLHEMKNGNDDLSVNCVFETKSTDSPNAPVGSNDSPEMKKNVTKLIAILDKVSEQKVVKNLEFEKV